MDYMNDGMDEELVRLFFESQNQEEASSSRRPRRQRINIERNREDRHDRLFNDYFSETPVYTNEQFRQRYRMHKHVFLHIVEALGQHDEYFQMRVDATGRSSLSPLQKCTVVIRMLAYGTSADIVDAYLRIGETTTLKYVDKFTRGVISVFGAQYLQRPDTQDIEHLLQTGEVRGFSGSNNDINVLNESNVFNNVLQGRAPEVHYTINHTEYNMGYYLSDGVYPEWATFVKKSQCRKGIR
ncbi:uncharacterized protein LOC131627906 [Vicia villosa]|uniref:uncharacterized protein LOC131627906 n=1 Tax=Vicia villosa TaxID=3911 RepID=UPI00273B26CE|nr:uncharacterized protein LOC131627906 [Vicia villosa]